MNYEYGQIISSGSEIFRCVCVGGGGGGGPIATILNQVIVIINGS